MAAALVQHARVPLAPRDFRRDEAGDGSSPEVVAAMRETGIDLSTATPQYFSTDLAKDAHIVITMGCGDECPLIPGVERDDWPIEDPKGKPAETVRRYGMR
jgi:arsenate reductase